MCSWPHSQIVSLPNSLAVGRGRFERCAHRCGVLDGQLCDALADVVCARVGHVRMSAAARLPGHRSHVAKVATPLAVTWPTH